MAENTLISWATHTFNGWEGCTKVSAGCANCYAENRNARFGGGEAPNWGKGAPRRRTSEANWREPLKWNRQAEKTGMRPRVFCASLADIFDEEAPHRWRTDLFRLIYETPNLDWLILTKRPQNIVLHLAAAMTIAYGVPIVDSPFANWLEGWAAEGKAPKNVWLGTSVENQEAADKRIPELLKVPAKVRFLSCEPLLGPVDLGHVLRWWDEPSALKEFLDVLRGDVVNDPSPGFRGFRGALQPPTKIHWVICGGESGPNARPMHLDWARSLRDQCKVAGVAFHFKQWGEWHPTLTQEEMADWKPIDDSKRIHIWPDEEVSLNIGKKAAGRNLDGREWNGLPEAPS